MTQDQVCPIGACFCTVLVVAVSHAKTATSDEENSSATGRCVLPRLCSPCLFKNSRTSRACTTACSALQMLEHSTPSKARSGSKCKQESQAGSQKANASAQDVCDSWSPAHHLQAMKLLQILGSWWDTVAKYSKDPGLHHVVVAPFAVNHLSQARIGIQHSVHSTECCTLCLHPGTILGIDLLGAREPGNCTSKTNLQPRPS